MIEKIFAEFEKHWYKPYGFYNEYTKAVIPLSDAKRIVQEVAKNGGWIPCSEQMPEFDQEVLITADDCAVYQCVMRNGGLCVFEDGWIDIKHVIAWQPLPAPYQKGE